MLNQQHAFNRVVHLVDLHSTTGGFRCRELAIGARRLLILKRRLLRL